MLNIECLIAHQSSITFFLIYPVYVIHFPTKPVIDTDMDTIIVNAEVLSKMCLGRFQIR